MERERHLVSLFKTARISLHHKTQPKASGCKTRMQSFDNKQRVHCVVPGPYSKTKPVGWLKTLHLDIMWNRKKIPKEICKFDRISSFYTWLIENSMKAKDLIYLLNIKMFPIISHRDNKGMGKLWICQKKMTASCFYWPFIQCSTFLGIMVVLNILPSGHLQYAQGHSYIHLSECTWHFMKLPTFYLHPRLKCHEMKYEIKIPNSRYSFTHSHANANPPTSCSPLTPDLVI